MNNGEYHIGFSEASRQKTILLPSVYEKVAAKFGCDYLNAAALVTASPVDGIHLDATAHSTLAQAIAEKVRQMLS